MTPMSVETLATPSAAELARFESVYAAALAANDRSLIPWAHGSPNPLLIK